MIDRIITGPLRSGLRGFVASEAKRFAEERGLKIAVITAPMFYEEWQAEFGDPMVWPKPTEIERISHVSLYHGRAPVDERLYLVEVSSKTEEKIGSVLDSCEQLVWIMRFSC